MVARRDKSQAVKEFSLKCHKRVKMLSTEDRINNYRLETAHFVIAEHTLKNGSDYTESSVNE